MQTKIFSQGIIKNIDIQNAYSTLITNIYLKSKEKKINTILITSYKSKEGKTVMTTDLAISMAMMGKKILLVDLDITKIYSSKDKRNTSSIYGMYQYLTGKVELNEVLCKTNICNLYFINSGRISSNLLSIFNADKLNEFIQTLRDEYDYIIFDTPSLESNADSLIVASQVDATILVAKKGYTNIIDIKKAQEQLNRVSANIIGIILNSDGRIKTKNVYINDYHLKVQSNTNTPVNIM